jgi:hypothetical protein
MRTIAIVNRSSVVDAVSFALMVAACARQLDEHVRHEGHWDRGDVCVEAADPSSIAEGAEVIEVSDLSPLVGVLGEHHLEVNGTPRGHVFANDVLLRGGTLLGARGVSCVLSHEVIEQYLNPDANRWAESLDGAEYPEEGCDAVEAHSYAITVGDAHVHVSDFLLPAWFSPTPPEGATFDYLGVLLAPFEIAQGGYSPVKRAGVVSIEPTGFELAPAKLAPTSRTARLLRGTSDGSTVDTSTETKGTP